MTDGGDKQEKDMKRNVSMKNTGKMRDATYCYQHTDEDKETN